MTDDTNSDPSIEIRLTVTDGEWAVSEATAVDAEVANAMADGHGNGKLSVMYQPDE